jgi:hypothetical protein
MRPYASLRNLLLAGAAVVALSCRESEPVGVAAPDTPSGDLLSLLPRGLLPCSPLPYDSVTLTVGPEGGTLDVGPHTLTVPPGALSELVSITAVAPSGTVNSVRLQPEGLAFDGHASLTMSYANCGLLFTLPIPKRVAYTTDDLLTILEYLKSVDIPSSKTVTGRVDHFSTYGVAW